MFSVAFFIVTGQYVSFTRYMIIQIAFVHSMSHFF